MYSSLWKEIKCYCHTPNPLNLSLLVGLTLLKCRIEPLTYISPSYKSKSKIYKKKKKHCSLHTNTWRSLSRSKISFVERYVHLDHCLTFHRSTRVRTPRSLLPQQCSFFRSKCSNLQGKAELSSFPCIPPLPPVMLTFTKSLTAFHGRLFFILYSASFKLPILPCIFFSFSIHPFARRFRPVFSRELVCFALG